jgi:hypothetical protein
VSEANRLDDLVHVLDLSKQHVLQGRSRQAELLLEDFDSRTDIFTPDSRTSERLTALRIEVGVQMADGYVAEGRTHLALVHFELALLLGAGAAVGTRFIQLLLGMRFSAARPSLKPVLKRALVERWADPAKVGRLCAQRILLEVRSGAFDGEGNESLLVSPAARRLLTEPLLLTLLERAIVVDPELEQLLTKLRKDALRLAISAETITTLGDAHIPFFGALANQCFLTEYAYPVSASEQVALDILVDRCRSQFVRGETPAALEIGIIASYVALHRTIDEEHLLDRRWPTWLQSVIDRQVRGRRRRGDDSVTDNGSAQEAYR